MPVFLIFFYFWNYTIITFLPYFPLFKPSHTPIPASLQIAHIFFHFYCMHICVCIYICTLNIHCSALSTLCYFYVCYHSYLEKGNQLEFSSPWKTTSLLALLPSSRFQEEPSLYVFTHNSLQSCLCHTQTSQSFPGFFSDEYLLQPHLVSFCNMPDLATCACPTTTL